MKQQMLDAYASQRAVLAAFGVEEERFRLAPPLLPWPRPHAGPLHYEARGGMSVERFPQAALDGLRALGLLDRAAAAELDAAPPC